MLMGLLTKHGSQNVHKKNLAAFLRFWPIVQIFKDLSHRFQHTFLLKITIILAYSA
jgi:hypothetical protein